MQSAILNCGIPQGNKTIGYCLKMQHAMVDWCKHIKAKYLNITFLAVFIVWIARQSSQTTAVYISKNKIRWTNRRMVHISTCESRASYVLPDEGVKQRSRTPVSDMAQTSRPGGSDWWPWSLRANIFAGMPFFKGRGKKVDPLGNTTMVSTGEHESVACSVALPYPATLKHQLEHLGVESLERDDEAEDRVGRTAFPPRNSGAQSITLPLNMPVFGTVTHRRVQPGLEACPLKEAFRKPARGFLDPIPPTNVEDWSGFSVETAPDEQADISPGSGKWFNDIDKLSAFKARYRARGPKTEQADSTEREWIASPKNFYKSILKLRQQKHLCNNSLHNGHTIMPGPRRDGEAKDRRVSFSPQALLFSFIDDHLFGELRHILETQEIDVNACSNGRGSTPLHRAVEAGTARCARVLLENGANVHSVDARGRSVLDSAFRTRQYECLALLVEFGANIEEYTIHRIGEFKNARDLSKTCYKSFEAVV